MPSCVWFAAHVTSREWVDCADDAKWNYLHFSGVIVVISFLGARERKRKRNLLQLLWGSFFKNMKPTCTSSRWAVYEHHLNERHGGFSLSGRWKAALCLVSNADGCFVWAAFTVHIYGHECLLMQPPTHFHCRESGDLLSIVDEMSFWSREWSFDQTRATMFSHSSEYPCALVPNCIIGPLWFARPSFLVIELMQEY